MANLAGTGFCGYPLPSASNPARRALFVWSCKHH